VSAKTPLYVLLLALVLGAVTLGGGFYETLLVDRVWPRTPAIIQPRRGGIDRKLFWGPVHGLFELTLLLALWLCWASPAARPWVIAAFALHLASRAWSFAYFIPAALKFERGEATGPTPEAVRWVGLSRWRLLLCGGVLAALATAIVEVAG
jgi:hypothetical protein